MSEALERIKQFRRQVLQELYDQLRPEQQKFFCKLYKLSDGIDKLAESKIDLAIDQCERTIKKNATR